MSYMQTVKKVRNTLLQMEKHGVKVYHGLSDPPGQPVRTDDRPKIIWTHGPEAGSADMDDRKREQTITGEIFFFTDEEYDERVDTLQRLLNESGIGWSLSQVEIDANEGYYFYAWDWMAVSVVG